MVDEIDLKLITELRNDGRATYDKLPAKLGISNATVYRRVERLLKGNIIRFTTVVDVKKLGYTARGLIALNVEVDKIDDVCIKLVAYEDVHLILTSFGRYDVFVMVHFPTEDLLTKFIKTVLSRIDGIKHIETFYTIEMYKGYGVFIEGT